MPTEVIVSLISSITAVFCAVWATVTAVISRKSAEKEGLQCLLRQSIINSHDKWTKRGYCPLYVKESLTRAYNSYHKLKGNDVATALYEECMALPNEKKGGAENEGTDS